MKLTDLITVEDMEKASNGASGYRISPESPEGQATMKRLAPFLAYFVDVAEEGRLAGDRVVFDPCSAMATLSIIDIAIQGATRTDRIS